ncbi:hypothetical protein SALBM217S_07583 [Streptomyces griseoloalbus]
MGSGPRKAQSWSSRTAARERSSIWAIETFQVAATVFG